MLYDSKLPNFEKIYAHGKKFYENIRKKLNAQIFKAPALDMKVTPLRTFVVTFDFQILFVS